RREPERGGKDDRIRLLGAAARGSTGLDASPLGRGEREARPPRLHDGRRPRANREARRPLRAGPAREAVDREGARQAALTALEEGEARADLREAEAVVELLWPVVSLGDQEDELVVARDGFLDCPGHQRLRVPAAPIRGERGDVLDLRRASVRKELGRA